MIQRYRSMIRGKTRIALAWAFVFFLGYFARNYPTPPGVILCFIGATIRFWASGYLRKDSRPAVGGPYAWVRNPLYLGTYLMAVGTVWAIGNLPLLAAITVLFAAIYHYIILDEETKLRGIFGAPYLKYCTLVPRFFPRPWPATSEALAQVNPEPSHREYDWALSTRNKAYEAYVSFAGLIGFVALMAYVWRR
jgi:protein-S-isoprenylcysteine O-methyltransferase Ste14